MERWVEGQTGRWIVLVYFLSRWLLQAPSMPTHTFVFQTWFRNYPRLKIMILQMQVASTSSYQNVRALIFIHVRIHKTKKSFSISSGSMWTGKISLISQASPGFIHRLRSCIFCLQVNGYSVPEFNRGERQLRNRASQVDCFITDGNMEPMDGSICEFRYVMSCWLCYCTKCIWTFVLPGHRSWVDQLCFEGMPCDVWECAISVVELRLYVLEWRPGVSKIYPFCSLEIFPWIVFFGLSAFCCNKEKLFIWTFNKLVENFIYFNDLVAPLEFVVALSCSSHLLGAGS